MAFAGLAVASVLLFFLVLTGGRSLLIVFGIFLFLACTTYLIFKRFLSPTKLFSSALTESSNQVYLVMQLLFFLFFAYSLLSFYLEQSLYARPTGYFIAVAFMASLVAIEILFLPCRKRYTYITIFKIILIGISLLFSQLLIFPSLVGIDPWAHHMFTMNMLETGHIPDGFGYSMLPLMHLMVGSTSLITGLSYKLATVLSISLPQLICNVLITFLLGDFLFGRKLGLLGGLFLVVANWHINMSFWAIPNTIAAVFIPIIIYLLLKIRVNKPNTGFFTSLIFMSALILTHTVTAVCMTILLFTFWAGTQFYNYMYREWRIAVTFSIAVIFAAAMLSWWTFASGDINTLGELIKEGFRFDFFSVPLLKDVGQYVLHVPFFEQLLNNTGLFLFFAISLIGFLFIISKEYRTSHRFVIALGGAIILVLSSIAQITGLGIIIERWWYFAQILLALPLSISLFLLCCIARNRLGKAILLGALTFSMSVLMILSPVANLDNPVFSPNTQVRFALTQSELKAAERTSNIWGGTIGVDSYYALYWFQSFLPNILNRQLTKEIDTQLYNKNYSDCQGMFVLIREQVVDHPFGVGYLYKLNYDPRDVLIANSFSKVYDCGSVSGFIHVPHSFSASS
ncbi:MAG: hypothetical protein NWE94_05850 [Candidatus Bathyarchaeota archaeon]|nr:hypothetical protein [Candidatus Bathyarchaeota archaeon]